MKIIFINNYPMDEAFELWQKGIYPGHHLWGILALQKEKDFEIIILKHEKYKFLNRLGKFVGIEKLDQQIRTLWLSRKCDVIYSPYAAANTKLIIFLKLLKIVRKPIVIVVHQPLLKYDTKNSFLRYLVKKLIFQYDSIIFLSENLKDHLISTLKIPKGITNQKYFSLNWGPEADFYKNYSKPKKAKDTLFAISAGHSGRDFDIIIDAFRGINFKLKIYCLPHAMPTTKDIPANVEIDSKRISYFDLLKEYDKARMILIPLKEGFKGTEGLTSLFDVLAMGKPVIMTKNSNVNIDIEKEGIGIAIENGTVENWKYAIDSVLENYNLLDQMGNRSLTLMNEQYNLSLYSEGLRRIFLATKNRLKIR